MDGDGVPHRALRKARATDTLAMSQPVFDEALEVLHRPRLVRFMDPDLRADVLDQLVSGTLWFAPAEAVTDCRDAADNKYLELVLAARASTLVSSDQDLLVLHPWRGIPILRPAEYLAQDEPPNRR
jgi:putative PIN family toxin of toxin-antitoxin system